jgi:hypothetical protein
MLMDSWLARKLKQNKMIFGHRVGSIPTNVLQVVYFEHSPSNITDLVWMMPHVFPAIWR